MPFSILVQRRKRDSLGQPANMANGEPSSQIEFYRFTAGYADALGVCRAIGIEAELRALMDEETIHTENTVQIPRWLIAEMTIGNDGYLNGHFIGDFVPRLSPLIDAQLSARESGATCFLLISSN